MTLAIGIDQLSFYIPQYYLDLATLAERQGIDVNKFHRGIGQEQMAIPPHDEDIVTLAANAALPLLEHTDTSKIDTVMLATETGIDQSKAAAVYVHQLLGLPANCRAVELKQACYSATAALQMACGHVARHPDRKVLVIASDISRYDLDSPAEATQGSGAVAMLVSANPRTLILDTASGTYCEDVMDFWRPNYRKTALVDGKFSTQMYLRALEHAWTDYQSHGGREYSDFVHYCYHLPFSKMGIKAHQHLAKFNDHQAQAEDTDSGMIYNRVIGNSYTASLYLSLISLLDNRDDLAGKAIALFSYGSGCVAEFFSGVVAPEYQSTRFKERHQCLISERDALDYDTYREYWHQPDPIDGSSVAMPEHNRGTFRLSGIDQHQRRYTRC
ncbi:hydroxymethylglutaryl-CoA synthase [Suttonella sp. R2A3]|uniref:hydroxymethylglutaryl-CoA synthase n=1 Tax=Suttonella sp. R2A3 TaxID=2908648 RepID=UPI001F413DDD|nr:hydroxymethylglutaryl-CoA synthase [Suttonella sp. R2A3]UJF25419.1 hydroxymethylglutaryl-CoA synthase [Suttonella sp. R2A3]